MLDFKIDSYIVLGQEKAFVILELQMPFLFNIKFNLLSLFII